jgi:tRNA(Ile)-lysidine synthase
MKPTIVAAVSGGPDSVYLLRKLSSDKGTRIVVGHVNFGTRGKDSVKDQLLVENSGKRLGYETDILVIDSGKSTGGRTGIRGRFPAGFEKRAREIRYRFLRDLSEKVGAEAIALAHTADDQVETILMRVFEGAGIGGLKGIPCGTADGIVRPILDEWKEDILGYLKKRKISYRIDRSNVDTRFERNWVRHVLIPLLEKRYGKSVKKRIFTLGERFRELDDYLEAEAGGWIRKNVQDSMTWGERRLEGKLPSISRKDNLNTSVGMRNRSGAIALRRYGFSILPTVLRVRILQRICFDRLGLAPNERLLKAMDRNIRTGGPSAKVKVGKGWGLINRYEEAIFVHEAAAGSGKVSKATGPMGDEIGAPGEYETPAGPKGGRISIIWHAKGRVTPAQAKQLAANGDAEVFDAGGLTLPLTVRPLRAGDRIRPFGEGAGRDARDGGKKVKEILIDRKIPRDDRWGRPVVCDAEGAILWIPGVLRSAHAPVTPETRKAALLRIRSAK